MNKVLIFFLVSIVSSLILGQDSLTIKGVVTDKNSGEPLPGVNIFISGTFSGTTTDIDGKFELTNVVSVGQTLVISMIGYERIYQKIEKRKLLHNKTIEFELKEKTYELNGVNIVVDEGDWKSYYEKFVREFIGERRYGNSCEILNPYSINFYYDDETNILTADCDSMLTLINQDLGYKIKFVLTEFQFAFNKGRYTIEPLFEELTSTDSSEIKEWIENRNEAYYTSARCFFKDFARKYVDKDKYAFDFRPYYLVDDSIKTYDPEIGINLFELKSEFDEILGYYTIDTRFDLKVVRFLPGKDDESILTFPNEMISIYPNGTLPYPDDVFYSGAWAKHRVSDLLPFDFEPTEEN